MRILYLTDNDSVHNRRFLEKLVSAGHKVWSWNLTKEQENRQPEGVQSIQSEKSVCRGAAPEEYRKLLPQLHSVVGGIKPDLVHAGPIQSCGYLCALLEFHPMLLMSWGSDLLLCSQRNREWYEATALAMLKADAFFCDCRTVREAAKPFRTFSDSQVVQFPWGVKRGVFSPKGETPSRELFAKQPGTTTFIHTRSYDPLYGSDVLLDAFRIAGKKNPGLRLLLLGDGSQDESVRAFVEACDLNAAVLLLGAQPEKALPMWFRVADAYISCAKSDGTSISLLEAMATGLPVIVTDIPSNREWVNEAENGWLAAAGNPNAVAERMLRVANLTLGERQDISESNQRVVAERADWDQNFPRLLEMYERLV